MGAVFRLMTLLLVGGFVVSMVLHTLTGDAIWRQRAMQLLKWGVVLALVFCAARLSSFRHFSAIPLGYQDENPRHSHFHGDTTHLRGEWKI